MFSLTNVENVQNQKKSPKKSNHNIEVTFFKQLQGQVPNNIFQTFKNVISLISDFLFRFCLRMLCSIVANFGTRPLDRKWPIKICFS